MRKPRLADLGVFVAVTLALALAAAPTLAWAQIDPGDLSLDELFSTPVTDTTASEISIRWSKPRTTLPPGVSSSFGKLRRYQVQIQGGSYSNFTQVTTVCVHASGCASSASPGSSSATATIRNLQPATAYSIRVRAVRNNAPMLPASPDEYSDWKETEATTDRPALTRFTVARPTLMAGETVRATVSVEVPVEETTIIVRRAPNTGGTSYPFLDHPLTVTIQNSDQVSFDITAAEALENPTEEVRLRAYYGTSTFTSNTTDVSFTVARPTLTLSMEVRPTSIAMGESGSVQLTLSQAHPRDAAIALTSSHAAVKVPARVTLRAGETTQTFDVEASGGVTRDQQVTITAELGRTRATQRITVTPSVSALDGITFTPQAAKSNTTVRVTVSLGAPAAVATTVQISTDYRDLAVPASIQFNRGEQTKTFDVTAPAVDKAMAVSITATLDPTSREPGASTSANLTINP